MKELSDLFQSARLERLRADGVLFFDVDDTLLARRGGSTANGETYVESEAAKLIPRLLEKDVRVCLMTGHGLRQLESRLLQPLLDDLKKLGEGYERRLFTYANAGATRVEFGTDSWKIDEEYASRFSLTTSDRDALISIAERMLTLTSADRAAYRFEVREDCILGVRPRTPALRDEIRERQIEYARAQIKENGLQSRFRVSPAGRTTIEFSKNDFSKATACADLFRRATTELLTESNQIEQASMYVGDEFAPGGNDREILEQFPDLTCISVGAHDLGPGPVTLYRSTAVSGETGPPLTARIISAILKTLD